MPQIALTLNLDGLDAERVEEACFEFGALAVSYTDQRDDPILEPAPGEFRLWPHSRLQALFSFDCKPQEIVAGLAHVLRLEPERITVETLADRVWEREWLRDFHPMCFGRRLWVAPHHSHVHTQGAVIVRLDPGPRLRHRHACHHRHVPGLAGRTRARGPGGHRLRLRFGRAGRGGREARRTRSRYAYDIDPQALTATRDNAAANHVETRVHVVDADADLPDGRRHPAG